MIRSATPNDIPALLALGAQMHAESPRFSRLRFSATRLESTLRLLLGSGQFLVVAEDGRRVVGGMAAVAMPHWASDDLVATDLALFVAPEARGGMVPARLIKAYTAWAHERGAVLVQAGITTGVNTETTAALYERMGLKRCGALMEA